MSYIFSNLYSVLSFFSFQDDTDNCYDVIDYEVIDDKDLEKECYLCKIYKSKSEFSNRQYKKIL